MKLSHGGRGSALVILLATTWGDPATSSSLSQEQPGLHAVYVVNGSNTMMGTHQHHGRDLADVNVMGVSLLEYNR